MPNFRQASVIRQTGSSNLTPAGNSLQDAELEASNGPEGEVGAAPVAAHRIKLCNCCQVVIHDADVADLAAGAVGHKHEDQQDDEDDDCRRKGHTCSQHKGGGCAAVTVHCPVQVCRIINRRGNECCSAQHAAHSTGCLKAAGVTSMGLVSMPMTCMGVVYSHRCRMPG